MTEKIDVKFIYNKCSERNATNIQILFCYVGSVGCATVCLTCIGMSIHGATVNILLTPRKKSVGFRGSVICGSLTRWRHKEKSEKPELH